MKRTVIVAGLFTIITVAGCGGGSVEHEHEYYESPELSGERSVTKIHVRSHDEQGGGYRVVEGQPVHVHVHAGNGQSICIEITTGRE